MHRSRKVVDGKRSLLIESISWTGVVAVLAAYGLSGFGVLGHGSLWYLLLNLYGGVVLMVGSYLKRDWEPAVINAVWFAVALIGIIQFVLSLISIG